MTETLQQVIETDQVSEIDMPEPLGWRVLIEPIAVEERTRGGIVLPDQAQKAKEHLNYVGKVVAMGPLCYRDPKFGDAGPWCQVGDWVAYGQYAGQTVLIRNRNGDGAVRMRLCNDDEILAKLASPESVLVYV